MDAWAPSPSPIALLLLELDERGVEGAVDVGERTVVLRRGRVIDVRPAFGDPSLHEFLVETGRIGAAELVALRRASHDPDRLPENDRQFPIDQLGESIRSLWLDRLVRGMARLEREGAAPPPLRPENVSGHSFFDTSLVTLVLDALARRAQEGDAEQVGARSRLKLEWLDRPHTARGRRWAGFEGRTDLTIAPLLGTAPFAVSRIAALVRAGLARIVAEGASLPPPAPRPATIPPEPGVSLADQADEIERKQSQAMRPSQAPSEASEPPLPEVPAETPEHKAQTLVPSAPAETPRTSLPPPSVSDRPSVPSFAPPRPPTVQLSPGLADAFPSDLVLASELPTFPLAEESWVDPLDAIEREIAMLEESNAAAPERARAWAHCAQIWLERYGSVEEAARCMREAAAATPDNPTRLMETTNACIAAAQNELALAYARAAVAAQTEAEAQHEALFAYAQTCRRIGQHSTAIAAYRATFGGPRSGEAHSALATILMGQGRSGEAADELLLASEQMPSVEGESASFLARAAYWAGKPSERVVQAMLSRLSREGRRAASIAIRAEMASRAEDPGSRRRILLSAAERAEQEDRPLWAADLLLRALDAEPDLEVLYDPLDVDLEAAGALVERAVVLEEFAHATGADSRAVRLSKAAEARLELPGDSAWEVELRIRALELDPEDPAPLHAVRKAAEAASEPTLVADALERAARATSWRNVAARQAALNELAQLCETATDEPLRAAWARSVAAALGNEPMARARARFEAGTRQVMQRAAELERISREGSLEEQREAAISLALILAQDPERRERALGILQPHIEGARFDDRAARLAERIAALRGDLAARIAMAGRIAEHTPQKAERVRAFVRVASLEAARGQHRAAAKACLRVLAQVPSHREALVRLRRAASKLDDHALIRDAASREAAISLSPAERARAWTIVATHAQALSEHDRVREASVHALEADPEAAEAALLLIRRLDGQATIGGEVLARARALVGDAPALFAAEIRAAPNDEARLEAADRWSRLHPHSGEPYRKALLAMTGPSPEPRFRCIEALLREPRCEAANVQEIAQALDRTEDAALERTLALAFETVDRYGQVAGQVRELASTAALRGLTPSFAVAALERRLPGFQGEAGVSILREIASLHGSFGDAAGRARALLRLLSRAPRDGSAIRDLASVYCRAGERSRLMAALALHVAEGTSEEQRLEGWIALATASALVLENRDEAEVFGRSALEGSPPVRDEASLGRALHLSGALVSLDLAEAAVTMLRTEALRATGAFAGRMLYRAAAISLLVLGNVDLALHCAVDGLAAAPSHGGLLLAFEKLALEQKDIPLALDVYDRLATRARGPNGHRALLYRRARWLERVGGSREALEAYIEAAAHAASPGAISGAIERLARAVDDPEALVRGLVALSAQAAHPAIKLGATLRAAEVFASELKRPGDAFELLFGAFRELGTRSLQPLLRTVIADMRTLDTEASEHAFEALHDELEGQLAQAWTTEERSRVLLDMARLHAEGLHDHEGAAELAERALTMLRGEDDVDSALLAECERERDAFVAARVHDHDAPKRSEKRRDAARTSNTRLPTRTPTIAPRATARPTLASTPARHSEPALRRSIAPIAELASTGADEVFAPQSNRMDDWRPSTVPSNIGLHSDRASVPPIATPIPDAPDPFEKPVAEREARADALSATEDDRVEALALYRSVIVEEPFRLDVIGKAHGLARRMGARREAAIAASILSLVDPAVAAPGALQLDRSIFEQEADVVFRNPAHAPARRLLRLVWEAGAPLLRTTLSEVGVLGTDRVGPHHTSILGQALADATYPTAAGDVEVFSVRSEDRVRVVRTHPPSVLYGDTAEADRSSIRFHLGRAFELATPEHILLASATREEGERLIAGIRAAFGPAEGDRVPRESAEVASELWRTMAPRAQREVQELLLENDSTFEWEALSASIFGGAARVGLVASGDITASLRVLAREESLTVSTARAASAAIAASGPLSDCIRFVFGDLFIDAVQLG